MSLHYSATPRASQSYMASPFRRLAKLLLLTAMTAGTLFTLQNSGLRDSYVYTRAAASLKSIVGTKIVPSDVPSDFDRESAMNSHELMDRWGYLIEAASRRFGVPKAWIGAVMRMESGGRTMLAENQPITSSAGAVGIMQIMPGTYEEMREQYRLGSNPHDPHDNIFAGTAYLRWLKAKYGFPAMFAAYNDGPGNFESHLKRTHELPAETGAYVKGIAKILGRNPRHRIRPPWEYVRLTQPDGSPI